MEMPGHRLKLTLFSFTFSIWCSRLFVCLKYNLQFIIHKCKLNNTIHQHKNIHKNRHLPDLDPCELLNSGPHYTERITRACLVCSKFERGSTAVYHAGTLRQDLNKTKHFEGGGGTRDPNKQFLCRNRRHQHCAKMDHILFIRSFY